MYDTSTYFKRVKDSRGGKPQNAARSKNSKLHAKKNLHSPPFVFCRRRDAMDQKSSTRKRNNPSDIIDTRAL